MMLYFRHSNIRLFERQRARIIGRHAVSHLRRKLANADNNERAGIELVAEGANSRGRRAPIGLILCAGKRQETIELLDLGNSGIKVSSYWTEALPKAALESKLHEAMRRAKQRLIQSGRDAVCLAAH